VRRKGVGPLIFFVLLTIAGLVYTGLAGNSPVLGLDLQGGVSVVLQPTEDLPEGSEDSFDQAVEIIRDRVDALGVAEPEISRQGDTVLVQLPGVKDQCRAIELVGQTAELRFRPVLQVLGPVDAEVPTTTSAPADGATTTTGPGGATTTTVVPTTTTTSAGDGEQGLGLTPGENAGAFQPATTTTTAPATATTTPAPADEQPEEVASRCRAATEGGGEETPTTTTSAPEDEQGFAGLTPGESAAAQPTTSSAPAPSTTAPAATPTVPGAPTTTVPAGEAVAGPCDGVADETNLGPDGLPSRLNEEGLTPRVRDLPCNTVVLAERDPDDPETIVTRYLLGPTQVTGDALSGAEALLDPGDPTGSQWAVNPTFREGEDGIDLFNRAAAECATGASPTCPGQGGPGALAIVLDGRVISAPNIQEASFERDQITITGSFDEESAKDLANVLKYGALPVPLEPAQIQTVSATLGEDSLRAGVISGIIGLVLTIIFMVGYYRLLGVVAIASLVLEFGLVWVLIAWLGESRGLALTLAGVTGLIVSIGISVDSNVVFYEHLKEDVRNGRTFRSTVERSFDSSFATIIKADIASLIGAVLLYFLSVGPVRGFALLLGISTVIDIFASWFFIRPAVLLLARSPRWRERTTVFGMPRTEEVPP